MADIAKVREESIIMCHCSEILGSSLYKLLKFFSSFQGFYPALRQIDNKEAWLHYLSSPR